MALQDTLDQLRNLDVNELDINDIGSWPVAIKGLLLVVLFVGVLVGGYFLMLTDKQAQLETAQRQENTLRQEMTSKWDQAANLDEFRRQKDEINERFDALRQQLPSDTEVPGLLEDITRTAIDNQLQISSIDLQPERSLEVFVVLPMSITVSGEFHNIGAFVSGVANLSRIVTLHDFTIQPQGGSPDNLRMTIQARTYRYQEGR
jgi:type IV pilus assembly protein PilO